MNNPQAGTWTGYILGYDVADGPQPFSLTASPSLSSLVVNLPEGAPIIVEPNEPASFEVQILAIGDTLVPDSPTPSTIGSTAEPSRPPCSPPSAAIRPAGPQPSRVRAAPRPPSSTLVPKARSAAW